jgi:hypothetical protein
VSDNGISRPNWQFGNSIVYFRRTGQQNLPPYGTVTAYAVGMTDGTERVLIHGQSLTRPPMSSIEPLTIATTPSLSLGPEGISMHFMLTMMKQGVDGILFGPERARKDLGMGEDGQREVASRLSLPSSADAMHKMADRLAEERGIDLGSLLWGGISLGAIKGLAFAALGPDHNRRISYGHFAVPVRPNPAPVPTEREFRRFALAEAPATLRFAGGVVLRDIRKARQQMRADLRRHRQPAELMRDMVNPLRLHMDIARMLVPGGLARHYAHSFPRDPEFKIFTLGWLRAIATGDAGVAAQHLPLDQMFTLELFNQDQGGTYAEWAEKTTLQRAAGSTYVIEEQGKHSDALNLAHQQKRAGWLKSVIRRLQAGVPIEEIAHPLASRPARSSR